MATNPAHWYRDTRQYLAEVQTEYKKITWPPQAEAIAGTKSVIVVVAIITTALAAVDFVLSQLMQFVLQ